MIFIDQIGNRISIETVPHKIVSLVPSQTELLHYFGLEQSVIGITKFCIHPQIWFKNKTRIGGTKNLNIEKIKELNPDIIIGNKEENVKEQIEELQKYFPVWMSDISSLDDSYKMILSLGEIFDKKEISYSLVKSIKYNFLELTNTIANHNSVLYLIWNKPIITVGSNTFIDSILSTLNLKNIITDVRYPEITLDYLQKLNPDFIFLSSEPFPFSSKHIQVFQRLLPQSKVFLVDGEMFSWYGSKLLETPNYLSSLLKKL